MEVVSLRQFADSNNISYEAVRKQVIRYQKELEGHIVKDGQTQYLDDEAVKFLKERRKKNPVILANLSQEEEIQNLKEQLSAVKDALISVQEQLTKAKDDLLKEKDRVITLQDNAVKYNILLEDNQAKDDQIAELKQEAEDLRTESESLRKEKEAAEADAQSFRKSIFGFYRKK